MFSNDVACLIYRCYFAVEDFVKILLISISVNDDGPNTVLNIIVRVRNKYCHF